MTNTRPTISLVTPNYNGEQFLETTLRSVLDQSYEALDYVLVDGASTDGSAAILKRHEDQVSSVIIEPDNGHADAINKGFAATQGEIMGWINSDDVLLPGCLSIVSQVFERYPEIEWITGLPSTCDSGGRMNYVGPLKPWSRLRFLAGDHLWIQQESTFWRRSLWDRAGGALDTQFDVANDFDLWARFFRHADLYSVDSMLGCFRIRDGQRSVESHALYMREVDRILKRELSLADPEFRSRHGSLLPESPRHLSPAERTALTPQLSVCDPPPVTRHALRSGSPLLPDITVDLPKPAQAPASSSSAGWTGVAFRNRHFIAGAFIVLLLGAAVAAWLPAVAVWVALGLGLGFLASLTAAIAIKTRRIVRTLLVAVEESRSSGAREAYARHMIELELDRLNRRPGSDDR